MALAAKNPFAWSWSSHRGNVPADVAEANDSFAMRRHVVAMLIIVAAGIIYVSLIPFSFRSQPLTDAWACFCLAMAPHPIASPPDFLANIFLFIPLAYLMMSALDGRRGGSLVATVSSLLLCALLSLAVEFAQVYVPRRTPDLDDVLAHVLGACVGAIAWHWFGRALAYRCRIAWETRDSSMVAVPMLVGYVLALLILHLLPFTFTVPSTSVWRNLDFDVSRLFSDGLPSEDRLVWDLIYFLPAGFIAGRMTARAWRPTSAWRLALALALLTASAIKVVESIGGVHRFDAREIVVGAAAFMIGWVACHAYYHHSPLRGNSASPMMLGLLILAASTWLLIVPHVLHGAAVDYSSDFGPLFRRLRGMNRLPFAELLSSDPLVALRTLFQKALLFWPAGLLLTLLFPRLARVEYGLPVVLIAAVTALVLEFGPVVVPHAEILVTVILVESAGAWLGFALAVFTFTSHLDSPRRHIRATTIEPVWLHQPASPP